MTTDTSPASENIQTAELIRTQLPDIPFEISGTKTYADLKVEPENFLLLVDGLHKNDALSFDLLRNIVALDMGEEGLWAKYHFYSFMHGHGIQVTVPANSNDLTIPSITNIYPTANWHEREAAEMVGLKFQGHPDPRNLLLEEDLDIHPLRKEHPLQKPEILQGIEEGPPGVEQ